MIRFLSASIAGLVAFTASGFAKPCDSGNEFFFNNMRENIAAELPYWKKNGMLPLTPEEFELLETTIPTIKVDCQDRVYLDPKDLSTEVSFINEPQKSPAQKHLPRITIGVIRWQENSHERLKERVEKGASSDLELRMMLVHEFLGASRIRDAQFEKTTVLKTALLREWNEYRDALLKGVERLMELSRKDYAEERIALYRALADSVFADPDYQKCLKIKGLSDRAKKHKKLYCDPVFAKLNTVLQSTLTDLLGPGRDADIRERDELLKALDEKVLHQNEIAPSKAFHSYRHMAYWMGWSYLNELRNVINTNATEVRDNLDKARGVYENRFKPVIINDEAYGNLMQYCPRKLGIAERSACVKRYMEMIFDTLDKEFAAARAKFDAPLDGTGVFTRQVLPF